MRCSFLERLATCPALRDRAAEFFRCSEKGVPDPMRVTGDSLSFCESIRQKIVWPGIPPGRKGYLLTNSISMNPQRLHVFLRKIVGHRIESVLDHDLLTFFAEHEFDEFGPKRIESLVRIPVQVNIQEPRQRIIA